MSIPAIPAYPLPGAADLPPGRVAWRPDPTRAALLVHDMQRYFTDRFDGDLIHRVSGHIALLRKHAANLGIPVFYTAQPGGQDLAERGLLLDFWGAGLPADPVAESIVDDLTPAPGDTVLVKRRYSAFTRTDFEERLVAAGRDQLIVTGVYAHIGVVATACDAFMRDIQPFVVADAVGDFSADYHRSALTYAAERCATVTTTDALIQELTR